MGRNLILGIFSLAILTAGITGMKRLRYIERSAWVFKTNNEQSFRRDRFNRGGDDGREFRPGTEDFSEGRRPDFRNIPDSVRQRMFAEREFRTQNDSLREGQTRTFTRDREPFRDGSFERGGRRGHNFRRSRTIQLGNVGWFLSVFAGFSLITIYLDKLFRTINNRNKGNR